MKSSNEWIIIIIIRPRDSQQKKRTCLIVDSTVSADHRVKIKESEKSHKYLDLVRELKKDETWKWRWCILCLMHLGQSPKIGKGTGRFWNKRTSWDPPDYSITKIGQNPEKSPGELRWLLVTQISMRNHQLALGWKTLKWTTRPYSN